MFLLFKYGFFYYLSKLFTYCWCLHKSLYLPHHNVANWINLSHLSIDILVYSELLHFALVLWCLSSVYIISYYWHFTSYKFKWFISLRAYIILVFSTGWIASMFDWLYNCSSCFSTNVFVPSTTVIFITVCKFLFWHDRMHELQS